MGKNVYMVRYETYDVKRIDIFCQSKEINGIYLGDLFCQKRMFHNGLVDLILFINKIMQSDKELVYQVPLYVTGRNMDEVRSVLQLIAAYKENVYAIVQDMGTAELIGRDFQNIKLIWGQLGRVREHRFSDDFLKFLKMRGFYGMETADRELAQRITDHNMTCFWCNAALTYGTLGRICYFQYQTGSCDPAACLEGRYRLEKEDGTYSMSIDGYMMGKRMLYTNKENWLELCGKQGIIPVRYLQ